MSPLQSKLSRAFYRPWYAFRGLANVSNFVLMYFFSFDFKYVFGGLIGLGCGDLGVLGKHWMSSFQKTKEI